MEKNYETQLDGLIRQIEKLSRELLARSDRNQDGVIHAYVQKIDRLKRKVLALKARHFLKGGLYQ